MITQGLKQTPCCLSVIFSLQEDRTNNSSTSQRKVSHASWNSGTTSVSSSGGRWGTNWCASRGGGLRLVVGDLGNRSSGSAGGSLGLVV